MDKSVRITPPEWSIYYHGGDPFAFVMPHGSGNSGSGCGLATLFLNTSGNAASYGEWGLVKSMTLLGQAATMPEREWFCPGASDGKQKGLPLYSYSWDGRPDSPMHFGVVVDINTGQAIEKAFAGSTLEQTGQIEFELYAVDPNKSDSSAMYAALNLDSALKFKVQKHPVTSHMDVRVETPAGALYSLLQFSIVPDTSQSQQTLSVALPNDAKASRAWGAAK